MSDRDKIAFLRELAQEHFTGGNLGAAVATWQQVLAIDPRDPEAQQGITLAQMRMQGISTPTPFSDSGAAPDPDATMMFGGEQPHAAPAPGGGPFDAERTAIFSPPPPSAPGGFDADRTMLFSGSPAPAGSAPARPAAAPAASGFDADRTMLFNPAAAPPPPPAAPGFDAERTMMFNPAAAPAAPPAASGFDAERTMLFNPATAGKAPAPPQDAERTMLFSTPPTPSPPPGFDPDRTMAFNPSLAPPPAAPAPAAAPPPAPASSDWLKPPPPARPDADMTQLSPDEGFDLPPLPPPGLAAPEPPRPAAGRPLEDFVLPPAGFAMSPPGAAPGLPPPPTGLGGPGLPPPPPAPSGFSFELPPPPSRGGGLGLPDLPSVGLSTPPPAFTPSAPPPPPPPARKAGGQFGDVDPGEIDALAVPTIGVKDMPKAEDNRSADEREAELKRDYERQYGKTPMGPSAPVRAQPTRKGASFGPFFLILVGVVVLLGAAAWFGSRWLEKRNAQPGPTAPLVVDPNKTSSKEEAVRRITEKLSEAGAAQLKGQLDDADKLVQDARDIAQKAGIPIPPEIELKGTQIEQDKQYRANFDRAKRSFCREDYPKAHVAFLELERARPSDPEPGKFIERMFFNLGVEKLQVREPWESVYYFEQLTQRNPADKQAVDLLAYAQSFRVGDDLGYNYEKMVDPLAYRMADCH